ncbi:hypothetical protein M8J77_004072 [Diaphorina citri]|nr:hypothetical protein M8J77_004072 [Diaphorina citri]
MTSLEDYSLVNVIKRGSFGTICLYRKLLDDQLVVIKQIIHDHSNDSELNECKNEVAILSKLHHPHIIEYFDSFIQHQCLHIVMEYATHSTLQDFIKQRNGQMLTQNELLFLFSQLLLAVHFIHASKILHRDIKPCNILLTGSKGNLLKLSDFGISKLLNTTNNARSIVGTPSYLSPELCLGKPYSTQSDIWAMGCVLYFMTTHKIAFQASNLGSIVNNILHGVLTDLQDQDTYDERLPRLIANMLEREPEHRPSTDQLMAHSLLVPHVYGLMLNCGLEYV